MSKVFSRTSICKNPLLWAISPSPPPMFESGEHPSTGPKEKWSPDLTGHCVPNEIRAPIHCPTKQTIPFCQREESRKMLVCKGRFVVWTQVASKTGEIARLSKESYGVTPDFFSTKTSISKSEMLTQRKTYSTLSKQYTRLVFYPTVVTLKGIGKSWEWPERAFISTG